MVKTFCENPLLIPEFGQFPASQDLEVAIVDDKSLEVIIRIEKLLSVFEPMGFDDLRFVHIEAVRGRIEDWHSYEEYEKTYGRKAKTWKRDWNFLFPHAKEWYQVGVRRNRELVYLYISRNWRDDIVLGNTKDAYTPRKDVDSYMYDVSNLLNKLEKYLMSVVESIKKDPQSYTDYLEENYPHYMRSGKISIKGWCRITKEWLLNLDEDTLDIIKELASRKPESLCMNLTLREYMKMWKIAYTSLPEHQYFKESSMEEVFRHSSKGSGLYLQSYDLDSEGDFLKWGKENSPYHCYDICYARVHLFAQSCNGGHYLELAAHEEAWLDELLCIAVDLYKAGVPFMLRHAEELLALNNQEGDIVVRPGRLFLRSPIGKPERRLPSPGRDGVTRSQYEELVSTILWDKFPDIKVKQ